MLTHEPVDTICLELKLKASNDANLIEQQAVSWQKSFAREKQWQTHVVHRTANACDCVQSLFKAPKHTAVILSAQFSVQNMVRWSHQFLLRFNIGRGDGGLGVEQL